jgi:hypothetical protein
MSVPSSSGLKPTVDKIERGCALAVGAANVIFPLVLFVSGLPAPWRIFEGETSPINWFSSVQCAVLGVLGLCVFFVTRAGWATGTDPACRTWPWLVLALGFFFLSFDEEFEFHETTRENYLKPRGLFAHVPAIKSGDVVLLLYVVAGAFLAVRLLEEFKRFPRARLLFVAALALIAFTSLQDALDSPIFGIRWVRHTQIIVEETGEIWAQALFALSLLLIFFEKLRAVLTGLQGDPR